MVNINTRALKKEIEYYGESITIRSVTNSSYSDWGDATESTSDTDTIAMIEIMTKDLEYVREGEFKSGDKTFYLKPDESISRGDRIQHNGDWHEVNEIDTHRVAGNPRVIEVRTQKI